MFSSPTPAPGSRTLAANALRTAGLIDKKDTKMRDVTGEKRKSGKKTSSSRPRAIDAFKEAPGTKAGPSRAAMLATRIAGTANASNQGTSVAIRGAALRGPAAVGRLRRNAAAAAATGTSTRATTTATKSVDVWRTVIDKRWNPESRFLNLERLEDDETLKLHHIAPPGAPGSSGAKEASVLFKLASQLKPEVQSLSLANNMLGNGQIISQLSHYLPKLANLSLENNALKNWKDIDYISGKKGKMEHLRELILLGNPLRASEIASGKIDHYKSEMARRFTSLELLDNEGIASISFDGPGTSSGPLTKAPTATTFPAPMGISLITGVDGNVVSGFLMRFFPMMDSQRSSLAEAYDPAATFSFSANTAIATRARIQGFHYSKEMPNQRHLEWSPWLKSGSRNLSRMTGGVDRMIKSIHVGGDAAAAAMAKLPGTLHNVAGAPEKFCVDAWPVSADGNMNLFVAVHGQFTEEPSRGIRSFDRSFILASAAPGSRANLAGWNVAILSDQWVVRGYSSHEAWTPGPLLIQAGEAKALPAPSAPVLPMPNFTPEMQAALASLPERERGLVVTVCQRSGLTPSFAVDCLQTNDWDAERALLNFEQVKASLGRDAYLA